MKKNKFLIFSFFWIHILLCTVLARENNGVRNGAAGIKRKGLVLTFNEANIKLKLEALDEVLGIKKLDEVFDSIDLPTNYVATIKQAYKPSFNRKYYKIDSNELSEEEKSALIKEYEAIIEKPYSQKDLFAFFALTDTQTNETYLLPNFYSLKSQNAQAAILWHEALWVLSRNKKSPIIEQMRLEKLFNYKTVVQAEYDFADYISSAPPYMYNHDIYEIFVKLFNDPWISILAAAHLDYAEKTIDPLLINNQLPCTTLTGQKLLRNLLDISNLSVIDAKKSIHDNILENLLNLMEKFPNINVFKEIYNYQAQWNIGLAFLYYDTLSRKKSAQHIYTALSKNCFIDLRKPDFIENFSPIYTCMQPDLSKKFGYTIYHFDYPQFYWGFMSVYK